MSCGDATSVGGDGELVGLDDEVFDVSAAGEAGLHLVGEGALLAALDAPRTGRMQDVVATIQAEQDVVIRRPRAGVTVVQGAPGTGKTAVALHRAAYLLYAERARLAGAVLFVGPSSTFLRYVEDVVPSLGEDRVVLATPADLGPAVAVSKVDPPAAAAVKGDLRMVDVLARAVRAHERAPRAGIELWAGRFRLVVEHDRPRRHRRRRPGDDRRRTTPAGRWWSASSCGRSKPRTGTASSATTGSAASARKGSGYAPPLLDVVDRDALAQALHAIWPLLTPEVLVRRLLASPRRLASAGRDILTADELDALHASSDGRRRMERGRRRPPRRGRPPARARPDAAAAHRRASTVGSTTWPSGSWRSGCPTARGAGARSSTCPGEASGSDRLDCRECKATYATTTLMGDPAANELHGVYEELAHQFDVERRARAAPGRRAVRPRRRGRGPGPLADAVAGDRPAVPDRSRSPSPATRRRRSAPARRRRGTASSRRSASTAGSVARHELTVNYRTPAEVMELAARLLEQFAPHLHPARSVRTAGVGPRRLHTGGRPLGAADIADAVADIRRDVGAGLVAVDHARAAGRRRQRGR